MEIAHTKQKTDDYCAWEEHSCALPSYFSERRMLTSQQTQRKGCLPSVYHKGMSRLGICNRNKLEYKKFSNEIMYRYTFSPAVAIVKVLLNRSM